MATFNDECTQQALFSSTDDRPDGGEWGTPQEFFDKLDAEFHFDIDAAASKENAKCAKFFTKEDNALEQFWGENEVIFCNPPYGKEIGKWLEKGRKAAECGCLVVFLIHARTDTRWFHEHVYGKAEIRFVKGRLKFTHKDGTRQSAPFPSMVVIYRPVL